MDPVLHLESVSVNLSGTEILRDIDFTLDQGDAAWLMGPNGAGKSTLLRAIASQLPFKGDITVCGHDSWRREARSYFTYAPDAPVLYEDLTLTEHAVFTSRAWGRPDATDTILSILDAFQLSDRLDELPVTHSRGMQQKLSLALAIGISTPLLLLDEPYDGLDRKAQPILTDLLLDRADAGGAILITTHQESHIHQFTTRRDVRVLELVDGRLDSDSILTRDAVHKEKHP